MSVHLWLRAETKPMEQRTALPPQHAQKLLELGFEITVEHCDQRIFTIDTYEAAGCKIAAKDSWQTEAPLDAIILGLKEFSSQETFALKHQHIQFAHAYKDQQGWKNVLQRFTSGQGSLYDLEFLVDDNNRRVAAFGYWAGYSGCAAAVMSWIAKKEGKTLGALDSYPNRDALIADISERLQHLEERPSVIIFGAKGRSGSGALDFANALSLDVTPWDIEETAKGGPFSEILEHNIFINCVFIQQTIPPFITREILAEQPADLDVICDVSCDPFGEYNPLPIYTVCTDFNKPSIELENSHGVNLVAIDHLPSLLPKESSEDFCNQLFPTLLGLTDLSTGPWAKAKEIFDRKSQLASR